MPTARCNAGFDLNSRGEGCARPRAADLLMRLSRGPRLAKVAAMPHRHDLASLDAVRGIAIALVIFSHLFAGELPHSTAFGLASANAGVILFFFLSGFLMDRTFGADPRPLAYVLRRGFRILPMYWLSIALILALEPGWSARDAIVNAVFVAPALHVSRMSGVYWTLYIEVMFYALVPLVFWLGARAVYASTFVVVGLFAALVATHSPLSWAPFYVVYCFAGMQIGAWWRGELRTTPLVISLGAVVIGSSALPVVSPYLGIAPLACAGLLIAALRFKRAVPGLTLIGNVSYSWYLLHLIIARPVLMLPMPPLAAQVIAASLSFVAAIATYRLIELPMIEVGKGLIRARRVLLPP